MNNEVNELRREVQMLMDRVDKLENIALLMKEQAENNLDSFKNHHEMFLFILTKLGYGDEIAEGKLKAKRGE